MNKKIAIIGSGFSGLSSACFLAKAGYQVNVYEKNEQLGGRARMMKTAGFSFDMGPSWYWMPDVFEHFFQSFGKKSADFYDLKRLSPSYKVFLANNEELDIPSDYNELKLLFEKIEIGAANQLDLFLKEAEKKYNIGMQDLVHTPSLSIFDFVNKKVLSNVFTIDIFKSFSSHIRKYFTHPTLIQLLEFPVLFLGAMPQETPALYCLMNYADIKLGTWYPMGGMHKIIEAMVKIASDLGVQFHTNSNVDEIIISENNLCDSVLINGKKIETDIVISSADYNHTEQKLLREKYRNYTENYWHKRIFAPSSLIFYLGINKKLKNLEHHNLFFDADFSVHAKEIYKTPEWPKNPLFYVSCPSKTDLTVAPEGKENLFILIPIAPGLKDNETIREEYFEMILDRLEQRTGQAINEFIEYKKSFCVNDFKNDYNSYKGNAYGLANTLLQTAVLKPKIKNKKVDNLFYTGQLTVPGPGIPPCLISGEIVAKYIIKNY